MVASGRWETLVAEAAKLQALPKEKGKPVRNPEDHPEVAEMKRLQGALHDAEEAVGVDPDLPFARQAKRQRKHKSKATYSLHCCGICGSEGRQRGACPLADDVGPALQM